MNRETGTIEHEEEKEREEQLLRQKIDVLPVVGCVCSRAVGHRSV